MKIILRRRINGSTIELRHSTNKEAESDRVYNLLGNGKCEELKKTKGCDKLVEIGNNVSYQNNRLGEGVE